MKQLLLSGLAAWMIVGTADAQTWQWGKRGGGAYDGGSANLHEQVVDLATDKNGNVYLLGNVEASGNPTIDGHALTVYGNKDVLITSFRCDGTYRWSKVIGGSNANDLGKSIATDTLGHVYVCTLTGPGQSAGQEVHFSSDTMQQLGGQKTISIIQYDTLGNFQWLRQPEPDTATFFTIVNNSDAYDLYAEGNGDLYWMAELPAGLVSGGGGWATTATAAYVLKYNAQGQLVDHTALEMQTKDVYFPSIHLRRTPSGRFIVGGGYDYLNNIGVFSVGGQVSDHSFFLAAFSPAGENLWRKFNSSNGYYSTVMWSRPVVDAQGAIYFAGNGTPGDTLNGYVFQNTLFSAPDALPFVSKVDSNGNHLWTKNASGINGAPVRDALALKDNGEVLMAGSGTSVWWDAAHHIQGITNGGTYVYTTRFDANGTVLAIDSLKPVTGSDAFAFAAALDRKGNFYLGGEFSSNLTVGSQTLINAGGYSDLFIAKYGFANCDCALPVAGFTATNTAAQTVAFTYTGTTTGIDSIVWDFGDGQHQAITTGYGTPVTHTYAGTGPYTVTVTVYNSCGSTTTSEAHALGVAGIAALSGVKVYPNPASNYVMVEGAEGASATLINSIGQPVQRIFIRSAKQRVDMSGLPSGVYLLILEAKDGQRGAVRISK